MRFIGVDNSTYQISPDQIAFFRHAIETAEGPAVLLCHIPLFDELWRERETYYAATVPTPDPEPFAGPPRKPSTLPAVYNPHDDNDDVPPPLRAVTPPVVPLVHPIITPAPAPRVRNPPSRSPSPDPTAGSSSPSPEREESPPAAPPPAGSNTNVNNSRFTPIGISNDVAEPRRILKRLETAYGAERLLTDYADSFNMTQAALDARERAQPTRFHVKTIQRSAYNENNFDVTWEPVSESRTTLSLPDGTPLKVLAEFDLANPPSQAPADVTAQQISERSARAARYADRNANSDDAEILPVDSPSPSANFAFFTLCAKFAPPIPSFFTRSPLSCNDDTQPRPRSEPEVYDFPRTLAPSDIPNPGDCAYCFADVMLPSGATPLTLREALSSIDRRHWRFALDAEYDQLVAANTWELVPRSTAANVISGKWVFRIKRNADGSIDRYKARWVARGFSQRKDIDFDEIFAPVVRYSSIRTLASLANAMDLELYGLDVSNAFARAPVSEKLHVVQPTGYTRLDPKTGKPYVCRLNTGLYGTKQAARLWHQMFRNHLLADGWRQYETDSCIFSRYTHKYGHEYIGVYVDDIMHICKGNTAHAAFLKYCNTAFPTTSQGKLTWILGMEIKRDRATRTLTLNQSQAISSLLDDCNMRDARPLSSPMDSQWKYGTAPKITDDEKIREYRSRVGSLMHFQNCTRPDIALAVNKLCRHMHDPNSACFTALNHVLRYLAGTPNLGIKYHQGNSSSLRLEAYTDSTFGSETNDKSKSQTGNVIYFGGGPIDWTSHLQPIIALSSCEAEQVAAFNASRTCVHFRQLLDELGQTQLGATTVWADNTACIAQSKNPVKANATRHVLIQYNYLRDLSETGIVRLEYVCTKDQVADILTKPLLPKDFNRLSPFIVSPT